MELPRRAGFYGEIYKWFLVEPELTRKTFGQLSKNDYSLPMTTQDVVSGNDFHQRLFKYYLGCLSRAARAEPSFFAQNRFSPDYAELNSNPFTGPVSVIDNPIANQIASAVKSNRDKQLYVGHIVYAKYLESRKSNWKGFMLFPLLIAQVDNNAQVLDCADSQVTVNPKAFAELFGLKSASEIQDAILDFEEELGLAGVDGKTKSIQEVENYLLENYPQLQWAENPIDDLGHFENSIDSTSEADEDECIDERKTAIKDVEVPGLYFRSLLFAGETPKYTVGLENELKVLSQQSKDYFKGSALSHWLEYSDETIEEQYVGALLEPIALNSEQRDAVRRSLLQPLTVITGPPGTGKSQVVSTILINAAFQGKTVLFASKNNKAVDVVDIRVNSLGPSPVLLRLGSRGIQEKLSEYLTRILSIQTSQEDLAEFEQMKVDHQELANQISNLYGEIQRVVDNRNLLADLDERIGVLKNMVPTNLVDFNSSLDRPKMTKVINNLEMAIKKNSLEGMGFWARIFPSVGKDSRRAYLTSTLGEIESTFAMYGVKSIDPSSDLDEWRNLAGNLRELLSQFEALERYLEILQVTQNEVDIGVLAQKVNQLETETATRSMNLWLSWLKTIPQRINSENRRKLSRYQVLTAQLASVREGTSATKIKNEQVNLFETVSEFLPCWAVTSLSVRNRIPLNPGYFDIVVIDEASQCDIASAIPLLLRAKRAVIIGDPLQLRHVAEIDVSIDRMLLEQFELMNSVEWSYGSQSLYDLASSIRSDDSVVTLRDHHRSDAQIIGFSNQEFYDGKLRVATRHESLKRPEGMNTAVRWIQVKGVSRRPSQGSLVCLEEAEQVVKEIQRLSAQGYGGSIGVVTPFAQQARIIKDKLDQIDSLSLFLRSCEFNVSTAHGFQGDERDLILLSPTLQTGATSSSIRFVSNQANLFNVAVTRARACLIVVGDKTAKELNSVSHIRSFIHYVSELEKSVAPIIGSENIDYGPQFPKILKNQHVSDFESQLYEALYSVGIKTQPQFPVDQYKLDLALFAGKSRLDIEIDGEKYHRHWSGENIRRDILRSQRLIELGWDVQRFWVYQVRDDIENCIARVQRWLETVK